MYKKKSLLDHYWKINNIEERLILSFSQKNQISPFLAKLLLIRQVNDENINDFLNPDINTNIPNPFLLKDMSKSVDRVIKAILNNENVGIIADYDVDGSTSATILYKFLNNFLKKIIIKTPNRLTEGYGPNLRIMDEMYESNIDLIFSLDCGTSSFNIIDNKKFSKIDVIVIDHHLSDKTLPNVFSIINPNRFDEDSQFNQMAAVGITFLFLMALRKKLREIEFFNKNKIEPNLLSYLDLVALGTVCDVVSLVSYNRVFVKKGLEIIKKRMNKGIAQLIDNSKINSIPNSRDLGFVIGPQLNAASRIDDSTLPSKLLISNDIYNIETISRKLNLLNEKRKLIEQIVYEDSLIQAKKQVNQNYILVFGKDWHKGVLGIVASKLIKKYYKPTFVISFIDDIGIGSARSIQNIDLGNIILEANKLNILISGGGHKMAAGLKINFESLNKFQLYLKEQFEKFSPEIFNNIEKYDSELSSNEINQDLLEVIESLEPFGSGNLEPRFIIKDLKIITTKVIKDKHILIFFENDFSTRFKGICFNCMGTPLGDYLLESLNVKLAFGCTIKRDSFSDSVIPQIIIIDAMIIN